MLEEEKLVKKIEKEWYILRRIVESGILEVRGKKCFKKEGVIN